MVALAQSVRIGQTTYAAGTDHTAMPTAVVNEIRNPNAWVGGTPPAIVGTLKERPVGLARLGAAPAKVRSALGLEGSSSTDNITSPAELNTALATKVGKGELVFNVKDYGAVGNSTTDDTAAIQAAINAVPAGGGTVYFPAAKYRISTLTIGAKNIRLLGERPNARHTAKFGTSGYLSDLNNAGWYAGTWLVSTATTGEVLTFGSGGYPFPTAGIESIGLLGPGTGTSTALRANSIIDMHVNNVWVMNFSVGVRGNWFQDCTFHDLVIRGCDTGLWMTSSNQNAFYNTEFQFCTTNAIRIENSDVNLFSGGVTEVNNGTPLLIDASYQTVFDSWYFEDIQSTWASPVTYAFEVRSGDWTAFRNCHWPSEVQTGRIRGNHSQVLYPAGAIALDLAGTFGGVYVGTFAQTITYDANTALNTIIDGATSTGKVVHSKDTFMPPGTKVYFGPNTGYSNWIGRNASTGHTEINSGSLVKVNQQLQANGILTAVTAKTANYTLTASDSFVTADSTSGAVTITLPTAVGAAGRVYTVKRINSGSNAVNVGTTSSQTIDGVVTYPLTMPNAAVEVISDGANWRVIHRRTGTAEVYNVMDFGAVGNGIADDTAAIQAAIDAAITTAAPASFVRLGIRPVYLPKGDYKITAPLNVVSVQGFRMFGEGISTRLLVSGTLTSVLALQGVALSEFRDFDIAGKTTADTVTSAIDLDWNPAVAARSTTSNTFRHIAVRDLKYVNAFALGLNSTVYQVDQLTIEKCEAIGQWTPGETTWWQNGFVSGSGTHANPLNHNYLSCIAMKNRYNVWANACNTYWWGGALSHAESDFRQTGTRPLTLEAFRTEHSQRLLMQPGGAPYLSTASIRDVHFDAVGLHADGRIISMGYPGELTIDNLYIEANGSNPTIYYSNASTKTLNVVGRNIRSRTAVTSFFVSSGATAPMNVKVDGYNQIDAAGDAVAVTATYPPTGSQVQTYSSSTTFTVPAGCKYLSWKLVGSTSGAGSGGRAPTNTAVSGGGSSGGAGYVQAGRPATGSCAPGATLTLTIGTPGVGGAAVTTDNTAGNPGTQAGNTQLAVGSEVLALSLSGTPGGGGGIGVAGSAGSAGEGTFIGAAGIATLTTGAVQVTSPNSRGGGPGGGPGGGITSGNVPGNGGNAGVNLGYRISQGSGGAVGGASPTTGVTPAFTIPGSAGGGGAASVSGAAQDGANAGLGGGAGGGGASRDGNQSGKGGDGSGGQLEMTWHY